MLLFLFRMLPLRSMLLLSSLAVAIFVRVAAMAVDSAIPVIAISTGY